MGALRALATAGLLACGFAACRTTAPAPQPVSKAESPAATPDAAPPSESPPATPSRAETIRDDSAVVVDPGVEDGPKTLAEAAKAEKERRSRSGQPVAVINDKTLPRYARQGQITIADPKEKAKAKQASVAETAEPAGPAAEAARDEQYWRSRGLEIRLRWKQAADEVKELEQRSTELRQQFYGENDPLIRDNRIKPEWDRVIDRLHQTRLDVEAAAKDVARFLDEGRVAGAQPGWLHDGEELEPPAGEARKKQPSPAQSIEPPVLEPPTGPTENEPPPGGWR